MNNLVEKYRDVLEKAQKLSDENFKSVVRWNFLEEAEKPRGYKKCLGLPFIIQIGANGDIYTCYPLSDKKEHVYGSLKNNNLIEILKSPRYQQVWKWAAENVDVSKCMPTCRQHNANKYLWWLTMEQPDHLNFI
jgi:radical SAM protein with 4Fe4S-binding SPASM domain